MGPYTSLVTTFRLVACTAGASRFVYICELVGCMRGSPATPCSRARGPRANAAGAREARHACAAVRARRPAKGRRTQAGVHGWGEGTRRAAARRLRPHPPPLTCLSFSFPVPCGLPPSPPTLAVRRVRRVAACLAGGKGRDGKECGDSRCSLLEPVVRPLVLRLPTLCHCLRFGKQTACGFLSKDWNGRTWTSAHGTTW